MASTHSGIAHQPRGQSTIEYLPLEEVKVDAWVIDVSSRIVLTQTFHNPSSKPTGRAKYVFPLPANAAVCAFELELENRSVIVGKVKEREEAALAFARATEQGKASALVERVTDDIFTISVGSIPANARVTAYLTFVMDLLDEGLGDQVRLQLPMYIAERYGTPPAAIDNASAPDSRTRVYISVDIQTSDVIHDIRSPTHRVALRRYKGRSGRKSKRRMSVVWKSPEFLTGDFVITMHAEGLDRPRCFAEVLDSRGDRLARGSSIAMQLTLVPKFQATRVPLQEYIFIIDRSGSMSNDPIETAKRTLTMLLRLLPEGQTTFNIFSFGSKVTSLWPQSYELAKPSLVEAVAHVAGMRADYGGTEIPKALQSAFASRGLDRPAVVFLLTDGQIHQNESLSCRAVISEAIRNSPAQASSRLFALGIGPHVSSDVCSELARHGNGEYLFALSAEEICGKCARLLKAGRSKNIERIDIDWSHGTSSPQTIFSPPTTINLPADIPALAPPPPIQQAPHSLTRIFSGIRFTVFAITSFRIVPTSVKLITKSEGDPEPKELIVPVSRVKPFRDVDKHTFIPVVHTLAARRLVMELDDRVGPLPTPAAADALLVSQDDLRRAGTVRLGLTYQLVTTHTSFVAVQMGDERIRNRGRNMAWARSRLQQNDGDIQDDNPAEEPTFIDDLVGGVSSFIASVFGFFGGPVPLTSLASTAQSRPRSRHVPGFPGTYEDSDSGRSESSGGRWRRRTSNPARRRSSSSYSSVDTFSTLSSLDGSSCSSCWTSSRVPSPLRDPIERAPSPEFQRVASNPGNSQLAITGRPAPALHPGDQKEREVYALFEEMDVDGSFAATPLLGRLVGEAVLAKARARANALGMAEKVWATVVVAAYVKAHLQGEPDLVELMLDKMREFVEAMVADGPAGDRQGRDFDRMVREAATLLSA